MSRCGAVAAWWGRRGLWLDRWILFLAGFALFTATLAPTVLWGDDAELQRLVWDGGTIDPARGHTLWLLVARGFRRVPWGDPAWRVNLVSAFFAALTLPLVASSIFRLTGRRAASLLGAAALALSHTFWLHAVRAEVYALHGFFLAAVIALTLRWMEKPERILQAAAAAFLAGLGVYNHLMILTILPALAFLLWRQSGSSRLRALIVVPLAFIAGAAPYIFLTLPSAIGGSLLALLSNTLRLSRLPRDLLLGAGYLVYQYPLGLIAAAAGIVSLWRHRRAAAWFLILAFGVPALLALNFHVRDQYVFYLPAYLVVAILVGAGAAALWDALTALRPAARAALLALALLATPVALYAVAPRIAGELGKEILSMREIPGRDIGFFLWPPKNGYTGALRFVEGAFSVMPEKSVLLADWTLSQPIRYMQRVEKRRRDIRVKHLAAGKGRQVPYLLEKSARFTIFIAAADRYYDMEGIRRHFDVVPAGPIFRLVRKSEEESSLLLRPRRPGRVARYS